MKYYSYQKEGRTLSGIVDGSGETIVAFNGFGCTHYIYLELLPILTKHFQIVVVDNRGTGKSESTNTEYSIKDLAEDAWFVLDQMGIKNCGAMGISMGGFIAQEFVGLHPERVKALSLMCTTSPNPDFVHPTALTEAGLRQFHTLEPSIAAEFSVVGTTHPSLKQHNPTQFKKIVDYKLNHRVDIEEQIRQNNAAVSFLKGSFDLSKIKCPTLSMCGENDRFVKPENVNAFKKHLEKCQTAMVPDTDHFFFLEKPEIVANHLDRFFTEVM
jgi:pimeloyl-ACP methyl ester carboxylesterase